MQELVFIKLGGSVLTDKTQPEALHTSVLTSVAQTLADVAGERPTLRLVIGHGGGSFGHYWAKAYGTQHGVHDRRGWQGVARVQDAMGRLNRAVVGMLLDTGIDAVGVQPSAGAVGRNGEIERWDTAALTTMVDNGLVPVVYGDVIVDRGQGAAIISTETVFSYLVPQLKPQRLILIGESGVWTADPHRDPTATRIPRIDHNNIDAVLEQASESHGVDVTGGMASKVALMWTLVQQQTGLTVQFVGPGEFGSALRGADDVGTVMRTENKA